MSKIWYDLRYEDNEDNEEGQSYLGPKVLYTSHEGLQHLLQSLQEMARHERLGRFAFNFTGDETENDIPFSHVEIADHPPQERKPERNNNKALYWFFLTIVVIALLATFGLIRLSIDLYRLIF